MERVTPRLLVAWLVGALALSVAVVGCGTITSHGPPTNRVVSPKDLSDSSSQLPACTMSNGDAGTPFDDLCLQAPPAGWTGIPAASVGSTLFLDLPQSGECKSASGGVFVDI